MAEKVNLTEEQKAVVNDPGGTLLVSAAAGSGKTMVLIDRVLRIVEEKQCDLDRFLMITFTEAAAAELRGKLIARLSKTLAERPDDRHLQRQMSRVYLAQISTVHAFCSAVLRDYAHKADLPADFSVCEEQEAKKLRDRAMQKTLDDAYRDLEEGSDVAATLDMLGAGRSDDNLPELIENLYFSLQSYCDPQARLQDLRNRLDISSFADVGQTPWGKYLIEQFHSYLDRSLVTLQRAYLLSEGVLDKYLPPLQNAIDVVTELRKQKTWDDIRATPCKFSRMAPINRDSCPDLFRMEQVKAMRSDVKDQLENWKTKFTVPSDEALRALSSSACALRGLISLTERFGTEYARRKQNARVLDFNDLEHKVLRLVQDRSAAQEIAERYEQIMVDEYQDTNEVQDAIFRAISKNEENLFFVGDVKQSIYGFRRADPTIFLEKYLRFADYKEAAPGAPKKILLSDNFRSHPAILEAANDVFRLTMTEAVGGLRYGDAEALRPNQKAVDMGEPAVELHCIEKESNVPGKPVSPTQIEAELVAGRIREMLDGEMIPEGESLRPILEEDIVILLRSLKTENENRAETYRAALAKRGIKCVCDNDNVFDSDEVAVLSALLEVIDNPHRDIPLVTVLLSPLFGYTADDLALARADNRGGDLYSAVQGSEFCAKLDELRTAAQTTTSLRRLLDFADDRLFIRTVYGAMENGAQRLQNIDRFFALADNYEAGGIGDLSGFVRYLETLREKGLSSESAHTTGAVHLTSIHKSKGLEYPVVFLSGLFKQFNPKEASKTVMIDSKLGIASAVYEPEQVIRYPTVAKYAIADRIRKESKSEEMRVLYVGMTRAKYRLVMTGCMEYLKTRLSKIAWYLTVPAQNGFIESARSEGDWVLMTAMTHSEAGELFAVGGNPGLGHVPEFPWKIRFYEENEIMSGNDQAVHATEETEKIEYVPLRYPHEKAVSAPSKVTATQLKGRAADEEIAEETKKPALKLPIRKPHFSYGKRSLTGAERGTAIHLAMQYLRYENCTDTDSVKKELDRLVEMSFMTPQQREAVPEDKILTFFRSDLGKRLLAAERVVREYKFSVLEDGSLIDPDLAGEKILLQGVTDCCLIEQGELTILDFKSDHVQPGQEGEKADFYRGQLDAYGRALSRVLELPVKERILYFFSTDTAINA